MRIPRTTLAGAAASALLLMSTGCSFQSDAEADTEAAAAGEFPDTIVLGAIPAENSTNLAASYQPIIDMVEEETGATVELQQASDYAGVVEGLIAGNVDLAFLGSFSYVIATNNGAEITPVGAVAPAADEEPGYYSLGIAPGDADGINGLADFADKDICFVDPGSTSGFLYPTYGLIEEGVISDGSEASLSQAMKPIFAGGHDASALAVAKGDCDAGFAMQSMVELTLPEAGEIQDGDLKEVWRSPMISGSLFVARDGLGSEVVDELTSLMVEKANADYLSDNGFCELPCLLTDEDAWGVKPAEDSDYDGVREVCRVTKSEACEE